MYPDAVDGVEMDFEAVEVELEKRTEEGKCPVFVVLAPLISPVAEKDGLDLEFGLFVAFE